ncbi:hypothetical protein AWC38_SpisGene12928 [Stylophora pistillata]|uniref:EGF-like domain-containing protein n=1 Tax=Stylophora pistillata TaxID=50429 RepID=A0A2B4S1V2_STYPI|nr:hypothetical protein AWC38_SpisGene12928 [Stylophora pistillata]
MFFVWSCLFLVLVKAMCSQGSENFREDGLLSLEKFHYLDVPQIDIIMVYDDFECTFKCLNHPLCMSVNFAAEGKLWCELLLSDKGNNTEKYYQNKSSHHYDFEKSPCSFQRCQNGGTCVLTKRTYNLFECLCENGFSGENCEKVSGGIDNNYTNYYGVFSDIGGNTAVVLMQCAATGRDRTNVDANLDILETDRLAKNNWLPNANDYELSDELRSQAAKKLMTEKWTISFIPHQQTFHYDSNYWSHKTEYNLPGGETAFDREETKLPTYWNTPFSKICLGMKIDQQLSLIVINMQADSLYLLIADEKYRNTSLGRDTWRSLIGPQASSQIHCNKEGFLLLSQSAHTGRIKLLKQESVLSPTMPITVMMSIPESGLVQEVRMMTTTRVESLQTRAVLIMGRGSLKPWGTSWCSDGRKLYIQ